MYDSLGLLKNLPKATKVYCAHEYTEQNLKFALMVEPKNSDLQARYAHVKKLRSENKITIPSNIDIEIKTNPFLRCDEDDIKKLIFEKFDINGDNPTTFKAVREWKDSL
jgi:hydroxyacylglutathione hydrolase